MDAGQNPLREVPSTPLQSCNYNQKEFLTALHAGGHNPMKEVLSQGVTIPTPIQRSLVPRVFQTHGYHGNHPFCLFPMDETKLNPISKNLLTVMYHPATDVKLRLK